MEIFSLKTWALAEKCTLISPIDFLDWKEKFTSRKGWCILSLIVTLPNWEQKIMGDCFVLNLALKNGNDV